MDLSFFFDKYKFDFNKKDYVKRGILKLFNDKNFSLYSHACGFDCLTLFNFILKQILVYDLYARQEVLLDIFYNDLNCFSNKVQNCPIRLKYPKEINYFYDKNTGASYTVGESNIDVIISDLLDTRSASFVGDLIPNFNFTCIGDGFDMHYEAFFDSSVINDYSYLSHQFIIEKLISRYDEHLKIANEFGLEPLSKDLFLHLGFIFFCRFSHSNRVVSDFDQCIAFFKFDLFSSCLKDYIPEFSVLDDLTLEKMVFIVFFSNSFINVNDLTEIINLPEFELLKNPDKNPDDTVLSNVERTILLDKRRLMILNCINRTNVDKGDLSFNFKSKFFTNSVMGSGIYSPIYKSGYKHFNDVVATIFEHLNQGNKGAFVLPKKVVDIAFDVDINYSFFIPSISLKEDFLKIDDKYKNLRLLTNKNTTVQKCCNSKDFIKNGIEFVDIIVGSSFGLDLLKINHICHDIIQKYIFSNPRLGVFFLENVLYKIEDRKSFRSEIYHISLIKLNKIINNKIDTLNALNNKNSKTLNELKEFSDYSLLTSKALDNVVKALKGFNTIELVGDIACKESQSFVFRKKSNTKKLFGNISDIVFILKSIFLSNDDSELVNKKRTEYQKIFNLQLLMKTSFWNFLYSKNDYIYNYGNFKNDDEFLKFLISFGDYEVGFDAFVKLFADSINSRSFVPVDNIVEELFKDLKWIDCEVSEFSSRLKIYIDSMLVSFNQIKPYANSFSIKAYNLCDTYRYYNFLLINSDDLSEIEKYYAIFNNAKEEFKSIITDVIDGYIDFNVLLDIDIDLNITLDDILDSCVKYFLYQQDCLMFKCDSISY